MTDGQTLFAVFAALYVLESLRWLPERAWLCTGFGRTWQLRRPWRQLQGKGWALTTLPMLPPVPAHWVTLPWLLVPQPEGVLVCDQEDAEPALLPWEDLSPHCEGATLFLNDHQRIRLPGKTDAEAARDTLRRWAPMAPAAREQDFLEACERSLNADDMAALAQKLADLTQRLRWLSLAIFVWCFGVISAAYWWLGDSIEVIAALGVLLLLQGTQAVLFWRASKNDLVTIKHRFWKSLAIAFLPQLSMRAPDVISKKIAAVFHPLAARGLIDEPSWLKLAQHCWKQARYGAADGQTLVVRALENFFRQQNIDVAQLEPIPERQPGSAAYCPRCLAQFREGANVCADCGGVALRQWPA